MKVRDLYQEAVCAHTGESLRDALAVMLTRDFSQLPIVDREGKQCGSLLEMRVVRELADRGGEVEDPINIPVEKWQDGPFEDVTPDMDIRDVAARLIDSPAVVVLRDDGSVGWILTRADLAGHILDSYASIPGNPYRWTIDSVRRLVGEKQPETPVLEFKREVPKSPKLARTVAGMANAFGGIVVIGVGEGPEGVASELRPVPNGDQVRVGVQQCLDGLIDPPLGGQLRIVPIDDPHEPGTGYLLVGVPKSVEPRMVDGGYWTRIGTSSRPMKRTEVKDAYRRFFSRLPPER